MDILLVNKNLLVIDYLKNKEFVIQKNKTLFLQMFATRPNDEIALTLGLYSLLKTIQIGHPYSFAYSFSHYIDYREEEAVSSLEKKVATHNNTYEECHADHGNKISYYFLNPIIYKNKLSWLDKLGALLYFTCGVKCAAKFHETPHIKKFIPSNGARYPFKATLLINGETHGLATYQYDMRNHGLIKIDASIPENMMHNTVMIIYKADVKRVMARYPNGIAYRDVVLDFGHLLATLKMCCTHYQMELISLQEEDDLHTLDQASDLMHLTFLQVTLKMSDLKKFHI